MTRNSTRSFFIRIFFQFFILLTVLNVTLGHTKVEQLDKLMNLYTEYGHFNGSVLVAEKGKVIYKKGFGMANMEWNIPNQANTKHRLGSITKQFTAVLIVQLAAEGKLDLYAPVSKYLPDYSKSSGDKITSHHLLTHTSGIPNYTSFPNFMRDMSREPYEPMEFLKMFADSTLEFTPGERFAYSNSGYFLLGAIIEKITGKSYEKVLQEKIFDPLKLNDTGYDHHNTIIKNRASGYEGRGSNYINAPYLDMSIPYAAGSMYSTVEDLFAWDQALYTEKLLPKKYMDLLFGKYIAAFGGYYGYGWDISKIPVGNSTDSLETIGHGGGINGFNTLITRFPSDRSSVILLNNTGVAPLEEITRSVAGILYGKTYDLPKKSVAFSLLDVINEEGIEVGLSYYREIKDSEGYDLSENEMNNAGYQLLQSGKVKEAAEVFKLNMEAFPASFNVYDSYAEAQMVQGQNDLAIKYYKKSIEINPGNQNGIDMLKKLGVDVSEVVKDAVVPDHILQSYVGKYELMPGFILTVTREGSQLKTQATGQSVVDIYPRSENVFYLKVITAQLTFNRNSEGRVESVTLLQGGQEITGKKLSD